MVSRTIPTLLLLAACGDGSGDTGDRSLVEGSLTLDGTDASGEIVTRSGFGYDDGDRVVLYFSSVAGVTCDQVATYLEGEDVEFDPSPLHAVDACNLSMVLTEYDASGTSVADDPLSVTWNLTCTFDDGSFVWEERDQGDVDWYWSGRLWQGWPAAWSATVSGGGGGRFQADLSMEGFEGQILYDDIARDPASGSAAGTTPADWCEGLARAAIFQSWR